MDLPVTADVYAARAFFGKTGAPATSAEVHYADTQPRRHTDTHTYIGQQQQQCPESGMYRNDGSTPPAPWAYSSQLSLQLTTKEVYDVQ